MKTSGKLIALAAVIVMILMTVLTACSGGKPSSTVNLAPIDDGGLAGRPTVAVPHGQMKFTDMKVLSGSVMQWSRLANYTYSLTSATTATFAVADMYGGELTLEVEFDPETDAVLKADATVGDVTVSVLTDDASAFVPLLQELDDYYRAQNATTTAAQ